MPEERGCYGPEAEPKPVLASSQALTAPHSPPQLQDLALGLESHVEAEGLRRGAVSLNQAPPAPQHPRQDSLPATLTLSASAVPRGVPRFFHQKSQEQNEKQIQPGAAGPPSCLHGE